MMAVKKQKKLRIELDFQGTPDQASLFKEITEAVGQQLKLVPGRQHIKGYEDGKLVAYIKINTSERLVTVITDKLLINNLTSEK